MIVFVPGTQVEALTQALFGLMRPNRDPREVTQAMFPVVADTQGNTWLQVDTEYTINVHPLAELDGIADILQPWIDAGELPSNTNTQLAELVERTRGHTLQVYSAFPALFKSPAKTRQQMIAAGLLAEPVLTP